MGIVLVDTQAAGNYVSQVWHNVQADDASGFQRQRRVASNRAYYKGWQKVLGTGCGAVWYIRNQLSNC